MTLHVVQRMFRRLRSIVRLRRIEQELAEELAVHLEMKHAELQGRGLSPHEAEAASRRAFGNATQAREDARGIWLPRWMDDLSNDVIFSTRMLRNKPVFAAVIVLTLAVGLGANTALFSVAQNVLFSTLAVTDADQLVEIGCVSSLDPNAPCNASYPGFLMYEEASHDVLSGVFAFTFLPDLSAAADDRAEHVSGLLMSGKAPAILGLVPYLGRWIDAADDIQGAVPVAVLGHGYWQRRFGGADDVVGRTLQINSRPVTIVGIAPPAFRGLTLGEVPDVVLPMVTADVFRAPRSLANGGALWLRIMGRRERGVSVDQVQATLEPVFHRTQLHWIASLPPTAAQGSKLIVEGSRFRVFPAERGALSTFRANLAEPLRILWTIVVIVLLITSANIAGLLVSRMAERRHELTMRVALGASRGRLARQILTESLLLAVIGGFAAVAVASWFAPALLYLAAGENALQAVDLRRDVEALAFTAALSLATGVLIAVASLLRAFATSGYEPSRQVRAHGGPATVTRLLFGAQVSAAIVLLVAAGLFIQTLSNYRRAATGFTSNELVSVQVAPALAGYSPDRSLAYIRDAASALERLSRVTSVTYMDLPLAGGVVRQTGVGVPGFLPTTLGSVVTGLTRVGPRFVQTLGLTLVRGWDFSEADLNGPTAVAIVDEAFARHFFAEVDPLDKTFIFPNQRLDEGTTIIGLVRDARDRSLKSSTEPWVYIPLREGIPRSAYIMVRAAGDVSPLLVSTRQALENVDRAIPIYNIRTDQQPDRRHASSRADACPLEHGFFGTRALPRGPGTVRRPERARDAPDQRDRPSHGPGRHLVGRRPHVRSGHTRPPLAGTRRRDRHRAGRHRTCSQSTIRRDADRLRDHSRRGCRPPARGGLRRVDSRSASDLRRADGGSES